MYSFGQPRWFHEVLQTEEEGGRVMKNVKCDTPSSLVQMISLHEI